MGSSLKKGRIFLCDSKGKKKDSTGVEFCFNPSSYTIKSTPTYKSVPAIGADAGSRVFISGAKRVLTATLLFDSMSGGDSLLAGLQENGYDESKLKPVTDKIKQLMATVWVEGTEHRPPQVIFSWGNLNFRGSITSLNEEYTMFTREGKPIRARVAITIEEDVEEALARMTRPFESPDRTKSRVVVEGMSLWSLAYEEYDDCEKWRIIARANHIMNPLDIRPGQVIRIPAL